MFKIDDKEILELEADLRKAAAKAIPFATRNTLNSAAFQTQKLARRDVQVKMIERNRFTQQSIRVEQSRTLDISRQDAAVGSVAPYMEDQEFGATKIKRGSEGVPIPTSYAAGQGQNVQPRTRLPRKPNRLQNIQLRKRSGRGNSRRQRNLIAIQDAATTGRKYVFLDLGRRKGIFKITGGRRRPSIKMVYDMTSQSVRIPRNPWLKPPFDTVAFRIPAIYGDSLRFQLKRLKLFKK